MKVTMLDKAVETVETPADKVQHPVAADGSLVQPTHGVKVRRGTAFCEYRLRKGETYDKVNDAWAKELISLGLAKKA